MGLLTNPKQRQRFISAISKYNQKLCFLLYVVGMCWFIALAYEPFNARTYFSENALLPGLVENEFYAATELHDFNSALLREMKKDKKTVPKGWILKQFQHLGLDVYRQNVSLIYPFVAYDRTPIPSENIYAILRARRGAGTEAVVMSSPLRPLVADSHEQTGGGIAIMWSLAKHFKSKPYLAKDIIFLMTEFDEVGVQAWLDGYHQVSSDHIIAGHLSGRSGQIQAAINLEIPASEFSYLDLKVTGLNGQLPNLDLVNLAVRLCRKEGVNVALNNRLDSGLDPESLGGFTHSLVTMLNMMWNQASGSPTANHGLFHRFHIEALTFTAVGKNSRRSHRLDSAARIIEGVFRSLNNLLERFHQSFFFYILPSTSRYVSIGLYMPPFALIVAAALVKAVALWIGKDSEMKKDTDAPKTENISDKTENVSDKTENISDNTENMSKTETIATKTETAPEGVEDKTEEVKEKTNESEKMSEKERRTSQSDGEKDEADTSGDNSDTERNSDEDLRPPTGFMSILPVLSICLLLGFMAYIGPSYLSRFSSPFRMKMEDSFMFGLLALFCASLAYPRMIKRKAQDVEKFSVDWQLLKCVALIYLALLLFSISLMNISLAFFFAVTLVPMSALVCPTKNRFLFLLQKLLLLLMSPLSLMFAAAAVSLALGGDHNDGLLDHLLKSWTVLKQMLVMRLLDQCFFGSWTYTVLSFNIFPCWLLFWGIPNCHVA